MSYALLQLPRFEKLGEDIGDSLPVDGYKGNCYRGPSGYVLDCIPR